MRSLRFVFIAITAAVVCSPFAAAEPVRLMCEGKLMNEQGDGTQNYTLLLAIDLGAGKVEVGSLGTALIVSKPDADVLVFKVRPGTVGAESTGAINRFTGGATMVLRVAGLERSFDGDCRTAQRLF